MNRVIYLVIIECAKELTYAYREISASLFIAFIYINPKTILFSFSIEQEEREREKKNVFFFLPGLRKQPPQMSPGSSYENYLLASLNWKNIIDEQARRRFQQQRQQQQYSYSNNEQLTDEGSGPGFTYQLPVQYPPFSSNDDDVPFAIGPGHPKFYEKVGSSIKDSVKSDAVLTYKNVLGAENDPVHLTSDGIPSYKVKAPMNVNPKIIPFDDASNVDIENSYEMSKSKDILTREDLKKLFENLERKGQGKTIANMLPPFTQSQNDVAKKPVDLNSAWVIGVIAGVSAAFTVGLLAIGIGWYT